MKKTTSALAIAALLGTGAASAATFQINDTTTVGIGGAFYPFYTDTKDSNGNSTDNYGDSSRLIFSAEKAAVDGATASMYYQLRPENGLGEFGGARNNADETQAGVATHVAYATLGGEFGSVTYGKNNNLMYRYIDSIRDYNDAIVFTFSGANDRRRLMNYASPDFDGFGFEVEAELEGDAQSTALVDGNGNTISSSGSQGIGARDGNFELQSAGDDNSESSSSFNAAAYADLDLVRLHAAYAAGNFTANSDGAYGVAAVTSIDMVDLSAAYTNNDIGAKRLTVGGLYASTSYSFGSLKLGVQGVDLEDGDNRTEFVARANFDIADSVYTSLEYGSFDRANDAGNGFGVALWYGF